MKIRYKSLIVEGKMLITEPKLTQKNSVSRCRTVSLCYCPALGKQITEFRAKQMIKAGEARFVTPDDIDTSPVPDRPKYKRNRPSRAKSLKLEPGECNRGIQSNCEVCGCKSSYSTCKDCMEKYDKPLYAPKLRSCNLCKEPTPNYWRCSNCQFNMDGVDSRFVYGFCRSEHHDESASEMNELVYPDNE